MAKLPRQSIIDAYHDLVRERGEPVGNGVFARETGISPHYWRGTYWRCWSDFQTEAGYAPNSPTLRVDDEVALNRFAQHALELNRIPTVPDLILKKTTDPSFPGRRVFNRFGDRNAVLAKVQEYCETRPEFASVLALLKHGVSNNLNRRIDSFRVKGFVYLLRSGKNYKLGRSNAVGRRLRELAIQLPQKPDTVHVIETDDPEGIEQYWHRRFADKRQGGEWFALTAEDVRAFKKRRFQ